MRVDWRAKVGDYLPIILPFLVFAVHSYFFRQWIYDDAGVSFAYARNLANGHGLVSQPGSAPVEGFSNFLWVILLAPFFTLNVFHPTITPKILSVVLVAVFYVVAYRTLRLFQESKTSTAFILTTFSLNTYFVLWSTSGMETPLYLLLLYLLVYSSARSISGTPSNTDAFAMGLVAAAIGMVRPEAALFFLAYPTLVLAKRLGERGGGREKWANELLVYGMGFTLLFGCFMAFRLFYFGDVLPNTFHAKLGVSYTFQKVLELVTMQAGSVTELEILMAGVGGRLGTLMALGLAVMTAHMVLAGRFRMEHAVLSVFLAMSVFTYFMLSTTAGSYYKYAVPFFGFFYPYAIILTRDFIGSLDLVNPSKSKLAAFCGVLFILLSVYMFNISSSVFIQRPPVPFYDVARDYAHRFNAYAVMLNVSNGSIMLPDTGGTLYYSDLRVYDLVGLSDKTIAKTLDVDQTAFYDYVFDVVKPTFIHTHGFWAKLCYLDGDPRFRRDYVPIRESTDAYVKSVFGLMVYSGDYVRRDVAAGKPEELRGIREGYGD